MEKKQEEKKVMSFFRIKTEWTAENEAAALERTKTEELVMAINYTDAEATANAIATDQNRHQFGSVNIEIIKTKINNVEFNDVLHQDENAINGLICNYFAEDAESGVGLYAVTVSFFEINEKTGKAKSSKETYYMPATSNSDAVHRVNEMLSESMKNFIVRDAKFDNAAAIYWPADVHQEKAKKFDLE